MITIPDNIDSKYRFVILSALRARQIQAGSTPMLKEPRHKATQIAQKRSCRGWSSFEFRTGTAIKLPLFIHCRFGSNANKDGIFYRVVRRA